MNPLSHVAIIMDGNGRWGKKHKNSRNEGHKQGLIVVDKIIKESIKQNIKFLTLYTFSTENWKRPKKEINYLLLLLKNFLKNKLSIIKKQNIKLLVIGKKNIFSKQLNNLLRKSEKETKNNTLIQVNIALNYGSRTEIIDSVKKIVNMNLPINENNLSNNLYTRNIPEPEILIRTGNTHRLSNFLLWQLSYTEIYFEKKLWPDFSVKDFNKILNDYKKLKRNFGSL